jgi:tetratricopeptide (TPR) repeat protein
MRRWSWAALVLCGVLATPRGALGQGEQARSVAEALFQEGRALMAEGRLAEACVKLSESQRLDPGGGTLLNVALCHERIGRTATAWGEYREALALARRDGRSDRQEFALQRIAEIEPQLAFLTIHVPAAARTAGMTVKVGNVTLGEGSWGTALPVDPGPLQIVASAPHHREFRTELSIEPRARKRVEIAALEAIPEPDSAAGAALDGRADRTSAGPSSRRTWGLALGAAGVVSIAVGSYFGIRAIDKRSESDAFCPNDQCQAQGVTLNEQARLSARLANVGIGIGAVAVGAAFYLILTSERGAATAAVVSATPSGPRLGIRARF